MIPFGDITYWRYAGSILNNSVPDIESRRKILIDEKTYLNLVEGTFMDKKNLGRHFHYLELDPWSPKHFFKKKKDKSFERKFWADKELRKNCGLEIYHWYAISLISLEDLKSQVNLQLFLQASMPFVIQMFWFESISLNNNKHI